MVFVKIFFKESQRVLNFFIVGFDFFCGDKVKVVVSFQVDWDRVGVEYLVVFLYF